MKIVIIYVVYDQSIESKYGRGMIAYDHTGCALVGDRFAYSIHTLYTPSIQIIRLGVMAVFGIEADSP